MLDNNDFFDMYDSEQEKALKRLPTCSICGEPIQDDFCYKVHDELICDECMSQLRVSVDDHM